MQKIIGWIAGQTPLCRVWAFVSFRLPLKTYLPKVPIAGNTQPQGYLHGGASAALAETVASHAAQLHAHSLYGEAAIAVGVELSISHVSPGRGDLVRARATAVHLGKSSTVHTVTITDEHDQTLAVARVSNRVLHN